MKHGGKNVGRFLTILSWKRSIVHINSDLIVRNNINTMKYKQIVCKSQWFINAIGDSSHHGISQHTGWMRVIEMISIVLQCE